MVAVDAAVSVGSGDGVVVGMSVAVGSRVGSAVGSVVGSAVGSSVAGGTVARAASVGSSAVSSVVVPSPAEQAARAIVNIKMLMSNFFIVRPPNSALQVFWYLSRLYLTPRRKDAKFFLK